MMLVIGLVLLVQAMAIVVLFAMLGELASRVPEPRRPGVQAVGEAQLGAVPTVWPDEFSRVMRMEQPVLLVLSTVCNSCRSVAADLVNHTDWTEAALVVSTSAADKGSGFVAEFALGGFPHYVDEGGSWVKNEFGVDTSPTALVFRGGQLVSAYTFSDLATLRSRLPEQVGSR